MMKFAKFFVGDNVYTEWDDIPDDALIEKVEIDFLGLGATFETLPIFRLEGCSMYMFQKYGKVAIGGNGVRYNTFSGFQIGGKREGVGWVVMDAHFDEKVVRVSIVPEVTTISIKKGLDYVTK